MTVPQRSLKYRKNRLVYTVIERTKTSKAPTFSYNTQLYEGEDVERLVILVMIKFFKLQKNSWISYYSLYSSKKSLGL